MNYRRKEEADNLKSKISRIDDKLNDLNSERNDISSKISLLELEKNLAISALLTKEEIMNPHNGHDPKLVNAINSAWNDEEASKLFEDIIIALMYRDKDEVEEKIGNIESVTTDWYDNTYYYLERVADDLDLMTILSFVRWDVSTNSRY